MACSSGGGGGVGMGEEKEDEAEESGWDEAQLDEAFDRWDSSNTGEAGASNHNKPMDTSQQAPAFIARLVRSVSSPNTQKANRNTVISKP